MFRSTVKRGVLRTPALSVVGLLASHRVSVLRYHSVIDNPEEHRNLLGMGIVHSTRLFAKQMEVLARKFNLVSMNDIYDFLSGSTGIPRRSVAVTFDDGYMDNYLFAAPILNRLGIPGAFYLIVDSVDSGTPPWFCRLRHAFVVTRRESWSDATTQKTFSLQSEVPRRHALLAAAQQCARLVGDEQSKYVGRIEVELDVEPISGAGELMMTWEQARKLHDSGHVVGSHTLTHPNLALVGDKALRSELRLSRAKMEERLGFLVTHFGYPSPILQPHWTAQTIDATREAGYKTAGTSSPGAVTRKSNPLSLCRIFAPMDVDELIWKTEWTLLGRAM